MAHAQIPPRAANDNHIPNNVVSFGQRKVLRETPTYLKAGRL